MSAKHNAFHAALNSIVNGVESRLNSGRYRQHVRSARRSRRNPKFPCYSPEYNQIIIDQTMFNQLGLVEADQVIELSFPVPVRLSNGLAVKIPNMERLLRSLAAGATLDTGSVSGAPVREATSPVEIPRAELPRVEPPRVEPPRVEPPRPAASGSAGKKDEIKSLFDIPAIANERFINLNLLTDFFNSNSRNVFIQRIESFNNPVVQELVRLLQAEDVQGAIEFLRTRQTENGLAGVYLSNMIRGLTGISITTWWELFEQKAATDMRTSEARLILQLLRPGLDYYKITQSGAVMYNHDSSASDRQPSNLETTTNAVFGADLENLRDCAKRLIYDARPSLKPAKGGSTNSSVFKVTSVRAREMLNFLGVNDQVVKEVLEALKKVDEAELNQDQTYVRRILPGERLTWRMPPDVTSLMGTRGINDFQEAKSIVAGLCGVWILAAHVEAAKPIFEKYGVRLNLSNVRLMHKPGEDSRLLLPQEKPPACTSTGRKTGGSFVSAFGGVNQ